jgi:hypothetical protein
VSSFKPAWKPPAPHQDKCTQSHIDNFFADCVKSGSTQQTCAPWGTNGTEANKACAACLFTSETASAYGPLIEKSGVVELNVAGCIAIAENHSDGTGCGGKYQASSQCGDASCKPSCPVTDDTSFQLFEQCVMNADGQAQYCKSYSDAATCADAIMEAGAAGSSCLGFQSFDDGYAQIAPTFCLATGDGGGGG